jgi:hypothetical protein
VSLSRKKEEKPETEVYFLEAFNNNNALGDRTTPRRLSDMPCPLYQNSTSENPLRVCGPNDRISFAPSFAHVRLFCLSIVSYRECPNHKLKALNPKESHRWERFLKQISDSFLQKRKEKKDGMSGV